MGKKYGDTHTRQQKLQYVDTLYKIAEGKEEISKEYLQGLLAQTKDLDRRNAIIDLLTLMKNNSIIPGSIGSAGAECI